MNNNLLEVLVVSPTGEKYTFSNVTFLKVKGVRGDIGILPNHIDYVTSLGSGQMLIRLKDEDEKLYVVSGGFLEIKENVVTVLAEDIIEASQESAVRLQREQAIKKATEEKIKEDRDILGTKKRIQDSLRR